MSHLTTVLTDPTLPQAIVFVGLAMVIAYLLVNLIGAVIDVWRLLAGKTDRDVEELALSIDDLAQAYRDGVSDQLDALKGIQEAIYEVHETTTEIAGYRPTVDQDLTGSIS